MVSAVKGNGFDGKLVQGVVDDIERLYEEMESRKGEYMAWCKSQREMIKGHYDRAKDMDIPVKALKDIIKARELDKRMVALLEGDDDDDRTLRETLLDALGDFSDTPLGIAARARLEEAEPAEQKSGKKNKAIDSLVH